MKRNLMILISSFAILLAISSCSKNNDSSPPANTSPVGTWVGTGQYGTGAGSPTYNFTLTFKASGSVDIIGNNSTATDNATGTWQVVQDSVRATYTYVSSSATYTLSGKINSATNVMTGTIGLGTSTSGVGLFSVTKQ